MAEEIAKHNALVDKEARKGIAGQRMLDALDRGCEVLDVLKSLLNVLLRSVVSAMREGNYRD